MFGVFDGEFVECFVAEVFGCACVLFVLCLVSPAFPFCWFGDCFGVELVGGLFGE